MKQSEAAEKLTSINTVLVKIGTETQTLLDKVTALQDAAANADNISPELQAAIEAVATQATKVDDLVPDTGNGPQIPDQTPAPSTDTPATPPPMP